MWAGRGGLFNIIDNLILFNILHGLEGRWQLGSGNFFSLVSQFQGRSVRFASELFFGHPEAEQCIT